MLHGTNVKVIKKFNEARFANPCPALGTQGVVKRAGPGRITGLIWVEFPLPLVDIDGKTWLPTETQTVLRVALMPDEIEMVPDTLRDEIAMYADALATTVAAIQAFIQQMDKEGLDWAEATTTPQQRNALLDLMPKSPKWPEKVSVGK